MWWIYALLSAFFAALTAIFAKIGVKGVDTDLGYRHPDGSYIAYSMGLSPFSGAVRKPLAA